MSDVRLAVLLVLDVPKVDVSGVLDRNRVALGALIGEPDLEVMAEQALDSHVFVCGIRGIENSGVCRV
jgi:hypothetical protein